MAANFIPRKLSEITPEWLTESLRESGILNGARVIEFDHKVLGVGAGFMGDLLRLTLRVDPATLPPMSVIVKLPTTTSKNRRLGQLLGIYEREIRFYRDFAGKLKPRVPRCYYADMDASGDGKAAIALLRLLDRMPGWIQWPAFLILAMLAGLSRTRHVLIIEDLGHLRIGDQIAGCSKHDSTLALTAMAELHAQFWNSETLCDANWILSIDLAPNINQLVFVKSLPNFLAHNKDQLTPKTRRHVEWLQSNGVELNKLASGPPFTLLHGDYRLDNMFFDDDEKDIVLFDWQLPLRGSPGFDLAYFLSASLGPDSHGSELDELLTFYHNELARLGVDISMQRLKWEYRIGMLLMLQRLTAGADTAIFDVGDGRGQILISSWLERILDKLEDIDTDRLLSDIPAP